MKVTTRQFTGASVEEQADGSAVLWVRSQCGRPCNYAIHLAPHVYQDIGFLFYQKFSNQRAPWHTSPATLARRRSGEP